MGSDGDDEPFSLAAALGQEKEPEPAAPDEAAAQDQKEGEKQGDEKAKSRSRSPRREKKHKKDRRRDRRRSRSKDKSRDDRRRDRRSRSRGGKSRDRRRSREKRRSRSRDRDRRRSRSRHDDRKRDDRRKSGGREEAPESGSRSPRSGRMYKDLAGREFRDQRSRQYPSRSRSFGKLRNKKKKNEDEEEPSASLMIQQMLAQKTNPMLHGAMMNGGMGPTAASMGGVAAMAPGMGLTGVFNTGAAAAEPEEEPSKCLRLENVVTVEELKDNEEYEELLEDMKLEAEKHGTVVKLIIPRPAADGTSVPGCGQVYIMFDFLEAAQRAKKALDRRKFGENVVKCIYMQEAKFLANELD